MIHYREGRVNNFIVFSKLKLNFCFFVQAYAGHLGTWADLVGFDAVARLDLVNG